MTGATQTKDWKAAFAEWRAQARANPLFRKALIGAAAISVVDQASKAWIVHGVRLPEIRKIEISALFDLTYVQNFGASFGLLAGHGSSRVILSIVSLGVVALLASWLANLKRPLAALGVAFIIGGAIGNLVDRVSLGYVVDFFDFSGFPFPHLVAGETGGWRVVNGGFIWVFNIADAAINVGIACLAVDWLREGRADARSPAAKPATPVAAADETKAAP
ncbi:MAG: signal peptidase II [Parvularculaceae bacterium]|nr:signal peptidase II [Parvularculaceae bacterium]